MHAEQLTIACNAAVVDVREYRADVLHSEEQEARKVRMALHAERVAREQAALGLVCHDSPGVQHQRCCAVCSAEFWASTSCRKRRTCGEACLRELTREKAIARWRK